MAQVPPFYSPKATRRKVYHVCSNCSTGRMILPENLRPGTNNWKTCKNCERLIADGKC